MNSLVKYVECERSVIPVVLTPSDNISVHHTDPRHPPGPRPAQPAEEKVEEKPQENQQGSDESNAHVGQPLTQVSSTNNK